MTRHPLFSLIASVCMLAAAALFATELPLLQGLIQATPFAFAVAFSAKVIAPVLFLMGLGLVAYLVWYQARQESQLNAYLQRRLAV